MRDLLAGGNDRWMDWMGTGQGKRGTKGLFCALCFLLCKPQDILNHIDIVQTQAWTGYKSLQAV